MYYRIATTITLLILSTQASTQIITEDLVLFPPDPDKGTRFGSSVALTDDILAVCAYGAERSPDRAGVIYLYDTDTFDLIRKIRPPQQSGYTFGRDVQINNDRLAINAFRRTASPYLEFSIFTFDLHTGQLLSQISNPEPDAPSETYFAYKYALGPNTLAVSDYIDNEFSFIWSGAVFLFNPDTGDLIEKFAPDDVSSADTFGQSLCFDDARLIVASSSRSNTSLTRGTAHIFELEPLREHARVPLHDELHYDSGLLSMVAIDGKLLLGNNDYGEMRLLDTTSPHTSTTMVPQSKTPEEDEFPNSIAYSPPLAIALNFFDYSVIHACLFDTTTGDQIARLGPSTSYFSTLSPNALAMNERYIVIGQSGQRVNGSWSVGSVFIYDLKSFPIQSSSPMTTPLNNEVPPLFHFID